MISREAPVLGMVLKGFPRISETFISNEILMLEQLGFDIRIFSMRRPRESFTHKSVDRIRASVDYLPETLLAPLPSLLYHNANLAGIRPDAYRSALGTAVRRFVRTRKSATIKHLLQAGYLVHHLMQKSGVAHLHAHFAHSPTSVAMFAAALSGRPFSFTAHAKDIYTSDPRQIREKIGLARFVVTCTEYNRRHLLRLGASGRTPVYRVYHGIDLEMFDGGDNPRRPAPPYRLLTVARLTHKKGIPTVLKAIRRLLDQGLTVRHSLIGDGDDRRQILAMIRQLRLETVTRWLGTLPHHEVLEHFQEADAFVLGCEIAPNGDRDGIPNVFAESMAMGVPVVATGVSAIPEIVKDGRTGLLVPPGRPEALAAAVQRLLTETPLRERIIPAAKRFVAAHFDNRQLIRKLADIYQRHGIQSR